MRAFVRWLALGAAALVLASCATVGSGPSLGAGDWVVARWTADDPYWYPAIVTARSGDELSLQYDDGDVGVQPARHVRPFDWRAGVRVQCRFQGGAYYYDGVIAEMAADRYHINVHYDDGDVEDTDTSKCRAP